MGARKDTNSRKRNAKKRASGDARQLRAEKNLRQFRLALDNSVDMILLIDRKTMRFVDVNQTVCKLLGYSREELLDMGPQDLVSVNRAELEKVYDEFIANPSSGSGMHSYYRCKDGSTIPFESTRQVLRSGDRYIIAAISRDIRERLAAEEAQLALIAQSAEKDRLLRLFYELPFVGLAVTSPSSKRWLQVNDYMCSMLGYPREELLALAWTETTHPDDLPANLALFQRLAAGEFDTFQIDKRFLRKDGAIVHTTTEVRCVRRPDGSVETVIIMVQDITERKQAEAVRTQLAAIVASSNDAIISRSLDDRILSWNAGAERLFGYTAGEALGQSVSMIFPLDRKEEIARNRALLAQGIAVHDLETERIAKGGQRVAVSLSQSPIKDEHGIVAGVALVFRDFRERKQAEVRRTMEHAVTRVLAVAETTAEAIPRIIQTICESLGWACGAYWRWDGNAQVLRCAETWHVDAADVADFIATTLTTINEAPAWHGEVPPGTKTGGLVRRVWMDGAPVWFPDVTQEPGFRRGLIAAKAGLHCAVGFPVMAGAQPLGVMEFYSLNIEKPDKALLPVVQAIGSQIGQFMARKQAEERIRHLADYDELTGLPNRSMFHQRLHHALVQSQRHARPLALLFIDLDYFKNINDILGHEAGDRVLKEFAERLRGCLRDSDTVGRLGGDEFVVLMEELPQLADAAAVAQKILDAVARPFILAARESRIGASIGISACPEDGTDVQTLLNYADAAMYRAKERGRNNYQFYSAQMMAPSTGFTETLPPLDTPGSRTK